MITVCFVISVARKGCTNILTRQYFGAISTHRASKTDAHNTRDGIPGQALTFFHRIRKMNLLTPVRPYRENRKPFSLKTFREDFVNASETSVAATVVGILGAFPPSAIFYYMVYNSTYTDSLICAQMAYGACILSFLGGVRWGLSSPVDAQIRSNWTNIGYSVTPPLIAWLALLMPPTIAIATLIVGFGGAVYVDIPITKYPGWYKALRILFTLSVGGVLLGTIVTMNIFGEKKTTTANQTAVVKESDDTEEECWWLEDEEDLVEEFISCMDD